MHSMPAKHCIRYWMVLYHTSITRVFALFLLFCLLSASVFPVPASANVLPSNSEYIPDVSPSSFGLRIGSDKYQPDKEALMWGNRDLDNICVIFDAFGDAVSMPGEHLGIWWEVYPMTAAGLQDYIDWYRQLGERDRLNIIYAGYDINKLDPVLAEKILSFFPRAKMITNTNDINFYHRVATGSDCHRAADRQILGDPRSIWPMRAYQKYMIEYYEVQFPAEREKNNAWCHAWTQPDVKGGGGIIAQIVNPFNDPTESAAAWDFGYIDGQEAGYLIGFERHKWICHNPIAFYGIHFPSPTYAQIYNNAFQVGWNDGYDRGVRDWDNDLKERDMYLKECKRTADAISAAGPFVASLAIIINLAVETGKAAAGA